jgi:hypothetical protein
MNMLPRKKAKATDELVFEVIHGVNGACLSVSTDGGETGFRLAGPKPWGGGKVIQVFKVSKKELLNELKFSK